MKKAFILLSDFHVMSDVNDDGKPIKSKSWLNCNSGTDNDRFVDLMSDSINTKFQGYTFYLIISGDLTNKAGIDEFQELRRVLERLISKLSISKDKILLIPGDHDVSRYDCNVAYRNSGSGAGVFAYDFQREKLAQFSSFYSSFFDGIAKNFDAEKVIVDQLQIDESKILFLGLNSNFRIGTSGGLGYIPYDKLDAELEVIDEAFSEYSKIIVVHHNFEAFYKVADSAQWDPTNCTDVKRILEKHKIKVYIYGNEHTPSSKIINSIANLSIGSLSFKQETPLSFNVLAHEDPHSLQNYHFVTIGHNVKGIEDFGQWNSEAQVGEVKSVDLVKPLIEEALKKVTELPEPKSVILPSEAVTVTEDSNDETTEPLIVNPPNYIPFSKEDKDHLKLLALIKEKNLFHSGHFHWSETSRAHNWIDVPKILFDRQNLLDAKKFILNIIKVNDLQFDFIIGLGIEGNMLSTRTAIIHNKPQTFLPYSYRYDDHSEYEKKLNYSNDGEYKTILIITDVVHDGRTIRKLIHKQRSDDTFKFFEPVTKVIVVALFYTGELPDDNQSYHDILNRRANDENFDSENDHSEDRIQFHFVSHIKVETCPYTKENYKTDCIVVREGLSCIHKFYSDKVPVSTTIGENENL